MKFKLIRFLFLLAIFISADSLLSAEKINEIIVDDKNMTLNIKGGENYQWYLNGVPLLSEKAETLRIKQTGHYSVRIFDKRGNTVMKSVFVKVNNGKIVRIFLVGDSTMQDYSIRSDYLTNYYPVTGWGEKFQAFMHPDSLYKVNNIIDADSVVILNRAKGGRSTRSFWEEGSWQGVQDELQPGDYVMIQFGHNDEASCSDYPERCTSIIEYKEYLSRYIDSTRSRGAIPILITPVNRDYPWKNGVLSNSHGLYPMTMKEVAALKNVPLIDAGQRSIDLFNEKGQDYTTYHYFMVFDAGTYPNYKITTEYPDGSPSDDKTHFQQEGAMEIARLVFQGLQDLVQVKIEKDVDTCGDVTGAGWYEKKFSPSVSISARPKLGWKFTGWSGSILSKENPLEVSLDSSLTIHADFQQTDKNQYVIRTSVEGNGFINIAPYGGLYEEGDSMQVEILPDSTWSLYTWVGDIRTQDNPVSFNIDKNIDLTAVLLEDDANVFQPENNIETSGLIGNEGINYTGDSYLTYDIKDLFSVTWDIYPSESQYYGLILRYASASEYELNLIVNDELAVKTFKLKSTGSIDNWDYSNRINYLLETGKNSITIASDNVLDSCRIDFLKIRGIGQVTGYPTGINETNPGKYNNKFLIYPNPTNGGNIRLSVFLLEKSTITISIWNEIGQRILTYDPVEYSEGFHKITLPLQIIESGIYTCLLKTNNFVLTKRLIIN